MLPLADTAAASTSDATYFPGTKSRRKCTGHLRRPSGRKEIRVTPLVGLTARRAYSLSGFLQLADDIDRGQQPGCCGESGGDCLGPVVVTFDSGRYDDDVAEFGMFAQNLATG